MTYTNILEMMETPGTHLHDGGREMPAPEIAKTYWRLDDDATMYEVLQQVAVDETNQLRCAALRDRSPTNLRSSRPNLLAAALVGVLRVRYQTNWGV